MAGRRGDLRAAGGGNGRAGGAQRGGFGGGRGNLRAFGRRKAGGSGRRRAKKPHTRGFRGSRGCARAPGSLAKPGQAGASSGRAPGKNGRRRGKTGRSGGQKAGLAGAGGVKSPLFLPQTGRRRAVRAGNWREKLAACVGLSGHVQGIFGRFRRKRLGLRKSPYTRI